MSLQYYFDRHFLSPSSARAVFNQDSMPSLWDICSRGGNPRLIYKYPLSPPTLQKISINCHNDRVLPFTCGWATFDPRRTFAERAPLCCPCNTGRSDKRLFSSPITFNSKNLANSDRHFPLVWIWPFQVVFEKAENRWNTLLTVAQHTFLKG